MNATGRKVCKTIIIIARSGCQKKSGNKTGSIGELRIHGGKGVVQKLGHYGLDKAVYMRECVQAGWMRCGRSVKNMVRKRMVGQVRVRKERSWSGKTGQNETGQ